MSEIGDFLDMMTQKVTVEPFLSNDKYGQASYGAATTFPARVSNKQHFVRNAMGEQVVARGTAWLATATAIDSRSRITLQDGTQPLILVSNQEYSEAGPLYVRLDFS